MNHANQHALAKRRGLIAQRGFSIVELMIVLVIVAVLMVAGAPSMGQFVKNNRLQAQTLKLLRTMHFARSEAVKRKVRVVLCRSANPFSAPPSCGGTSYTWTTGYLVFASGDTNNTYEDGVDELLRIGPPTSADVTVHTNAYSNRNLEYRPDGTLNEDDTARFAICDSRGGTIGRQIDVPVLGRPKLIKGSAADTVNCTSPTT